MLTVRQVLLPQHSNSTRCHSKVLQKVYYTLINSELLLALLSCHLLTDVPAFTFLNNISTMHHTNNTQRILSIMFLYVENDY